MCMAVFPLGQLIVCTDCDPRMAETINFLTSTELNVILSDNSTYIFPYVLQPTN